MKPLDIYLIYQFIKRLSTPFEHWQMYKDGIIDNEGNFLEPKEKRSPDQLSSYSYFDILILNLKRLLSKFPAGNTRIATLAAALYLLREPKPLSESAVFNICEDFEANFEQYLSDARSLLEDEGGVPVNNMSSGNIKSHDNFPIGKKKTILKRRKKHTSI